MTCNIGVTGWSVACVCARAHLPTLIEAQAACVYTIRPQVWVVGCASPQPFRMPAGRQVGRVEKQNRSGRRSREHWSPSVGLPSAARRGDQSPRPKSKTCTLLKKLSPKWRGGYAFHPSSSQVPFFPFEYMNRHDSGAAIRDRPLSLNELFFYNVFTSTLGVPPSVVNQERVSDFGMGFISIWFVVDRFSVLICVALLFLWVVVLMYFWFKNPPKVLFCSESTRNSRRLIGSGLPWQIFYFLYSLKLMTVSHMETYSWRIFLHPVWERMDCPVVFCFFR